MTAITIPFNPYRKGVSFAAQAEAAFTSPYLCVKAGSAAHQIVVGTANAVCYGFIQVDSTGLAINEWTEVYYAPDSLVWALASAAITAGAMCAAAADGKIATATDKQNVVCKAWSTCDADGDIVLVQPCCGWASV